ncbi:MAG: sulfatase-like hydrolase/transferase [Planctomycetaceae bacterium]|nr:sulfatase-like hydrolase/transferase [Planctomycetaceae bacterium]
MRCKAIFRTCALLSLWLATTLNAAPTKPNVLIILADDLGYSDLGCYGGEIQTPQLDRLAANGLRFTQFYNTARCWPSRAALLTGYYAQQVRRDAVPGIPAGSQGKRPAWAKLLPEMLRPLGYRSYISGKWHVDSRPLATGFNRSYILEDQSRFFRPNKLTEDDEPIASPAPDAGYYATVAVADHAIRCLQDHREQHAEQPFFAYVAFTSPHFPLHALPEDIARYKDTYTRGWETARAARWERQQSMGLVKGTLSATERDVGPPYHFPKAFETLGPDEVNRPLPWAELTPSQQQFQATKMAIHAAMVDRMDREIGRILEQLRSMNAMDNTLICFMSDNGASAEIMVRGDGHDPQAPPGSGATHLCLGPGWSTVANTPFRRHKTWVHEGGISTPLVVHWPAGISSKGELRHTPGHLIDLVPTVLEVTGGQRRSDPANPAPPLPGRSLVPAFAREGIVAHEDLWWEHEGNRALRRGDWKLVAAKGQPWELFDLATDRAETTNLAEKHPELVTELSQQWEHRAAEFYQLAKADLPKTAEADKPVKTLILPGESFLVAGRPAFILWPEEAKRTKPQPWVFYAPTLAPYPDSHEKWMHEQFLAAGVAVAGIDVGEGYGSPIARELFSAMYDELTVNRKFARKPCLLGRSRGGLWVTSWAIANPDKVAGIAGIYPVFDLRTYPGLERAAPAYGLTPAALQEKLAEHNPIEKVDILAAKKIPAFLIHGDVDTVVPLNENTTEFLRRYEKAGADDFISTRIFRGQGHNFWEGFFRCQELIDFTIKQAKAGSAP